MVRYYDIDAANARVAEVRPVLEGLRSDRDEIAEAQRELARFRESNGSSDHAAELARREQHIKEIVRRMELAVAQIEAWSVTLRDIGTGLIDFPGAGERPADLALLAPRRRRHRLVARVRLGIFEPTADRGALLRWARDGG